MEDINYIDIGDLIEIPNNTIAANSEDTERKIWVVSSLEIGLASSHIDITLIPIENSSPSLVITQSSQKN